jgi:hypothetical protein
MNPPSCGTMLQLHDGVFLKQGEHNMADQPTHVAIPIAVFQALNQLLTTMPYGQVKDVIDVLSKEAKGITLNGEDDGKRKQ